MEDAEFIISSIEQKIWKLIEKHNSLRLKHEELLHKEEELNRTINTYKTTIKELEEKNSLLAISRSIESINDSEDVKLKITELVREIDKCIGLLNR